MLNTVKTVATMISLIAGITVGAVGSANSAQKTVADVLLKYGSDARSRTIRYFDKAGIPYPPQQITMLAVKDVGILEIWAGPSSRPTYIRSYDIQALSGKSGPKLREGDKQVPEGIYSIAGLNPNSSYHLSIKLNYPNTFDLKHARAEKRSSPGSNIFIHGKALSIGCLAMGDKAIEELFVLTADVERQNVSVVIAPTDPRKTKLKAADSASWVSELYGTISKEFSNYIRK